MASKFNAQSGSETVELAKVEGKHAATQLTLTIVYHILMVVVIGSFIIMGMLLYHNEPTAHDTIQLFVTLLSSIATGVVGIVAGHKIQKD